MELFGECRMKRLVLAIIVSIGWGGFASAQDGGTVMVQALSSGCLTKLNSGEFSEGSLERGAQNVEAALLNGKQGRIWRTSDPRVVIVDFESATACDVMGLQIDVVEFRDALAAWRGIEGAAFTVSGDPMLSETDPDGVYFVRKTDDDQYLQITITSNPGHNFIGIVTTRVKESFEARDVLGEEE